MSGNATPIRRTLMSALLLTSGAVMLITSVAFGAYDYLADRRQTSQNLATLGEAVATNSTAALAFQNSDDAREVLAALKAERHIVAAGLYTTTGELFAAYPTSGNAIRSEGVPADGYRFERGLLIGVQPVMQGGRRLGSLYLESDLGALHDRIRSFGLIAALVLAFTCLVAYLLANRLQRQISRPILALARAMSLVSERRDYGMRVERPPGHEFGVLSDAFNNLLTQVQTA